MNTDNDEWHRVMKITEIEMESVLIVHHNDCYIYGMAFLRETFIKQCSLVVSLNDVVRMKMTETLQK